MDDVGIIVGADNTGVDIVLKDSAEVLMGSLLVAPSGKWNILYMVNSLMSNSTISGDSLVSAVRDYMKMESGEIVNREEQLYRTIHASAVLMFSGKETATVKSAPALLTPVREATEQDFAFLNQKSGVYLGNIRSGMNTLNIPVYLNAAEMFSHHVLIPATTGRGKSNLVKVMAASLLDSTSVGMLILDAHNEYYGAREKGLKDFRSENLSYYTTNAANAGNGGTTLLIDINDIKPYMLSGTLRLTDAQEQAIYVLNRKAEEENKISTVKTSWIHKVMKAAETGESLEKYGIGDKTLLVLARKLKAGLGLEYDEQNDRVSSSGLFQENVPSGNSLPKIISDLEKGKKVIVDTSMFTGPTELVIGSMIMTKVFDNYVRYKNQGELDAKPVIAVVLEEAPRVLSMVSDEENIFGRIAREGRKFKIGIVSITQLVSKIDDEILANLNTKIILGMEINNEREKIINSCAQDLSESSHIISSLDRGEAIISSIFTKFAIPVKVPLFDDYLERNRKGRPKLIVPGDGGEEL